MHQEGFGFELLVGDGLCGICRWDEWEGPLYMNHPLGQLYRRRGIRSLCLKCFRPPLQGGTIMLYDSPK